MPEIAEAARPGQFIEISTKGATLLNKPISIAAVSDNKQMFTLVYKVVGPGTEALSKLEPKEKVKVVTVKVGNRVKAGSDTIAEINA